MIPNFKSIILTTALAASQAVAWQSQCEDFKLKDVASTTLVKATYYPAGALLNVTSDAGSVIADDFVAFCRLQLTIHTTTSSSANTELWLPDDWNDRFLGTGNGGLNGGIAYPPMAYDGVNQSYAVFSTDTGHTSTAYDGSWALNNNNAIIDYTYRALHMSVVATKKITQQYYGYAAKKNYYLGCSTAGRQGLKEAQMFPEDFDGIVVGAPAIAMADLQAFGIHVALQVLPVNSSQWIPAELWAAIHVEVLKQCDGLDGLLDNIITDASNCHFRPEEMACAANATDFSACLTGPQINAVNNIYRDYVETNGTFVFSRYEPGGELFYPLGYVGPAVNGIADDYYKYFIYNSSTWDFNTFDYSSIQLALKIDPGMVESTTPNLTEFAHRGGKIIAYNGEADQLIPSGNSILYRNSVQAFTKLNTLMDADDFYKLYLVPGMGHCLYGDGANAFGGQLQRAYGTPPLANDAKHDVLAAMVAWIEEGTEPEEIISTHWNDNDASLGVDFTRKLCPYPYLGYYTEGNANSSDSFACKLSPNAV